MKKSNTILISLLSILLLACGGEGDELSFDQNDQGGAGVGDTGGSADGGDTGGGSINLPPEGCELIPNPFPTPNDLVGFVEPTDVGTAFLTLEGAQDDNLFSVKFELGVGLFNPNISPGTFVIDDNESDLETCQLCATIAGSFNSQNNQSLLLLAASEGSLELIESGPTIGSMFSGTFSDMVFREVRELNGSYVDVEDGCVSSIDSLLFQVTLQSPPNL